jgi:hypothetical protein
MVANTFSLIGANNDVIRLDGSDGFYLTTGLTGTGIPATNVRIDPSAADGGVWRNTRKGVRQLDLPVFVIGTTNTDVESKLRRLSKILQDRAGATTLRAEYGSGERWSIKGHYTGGAETQFGGEAGELWAKWVLSIQCPDPYWTRDSSESYSLGAGATGRSLIPDLAELRISSSQAIGEMDVENSGDVSSYPVWQIRGPVDSFTMTSQAGESFTYDGSFLSDTTVTINTKVGTVTDNNGDNMYSNLTASPRLFQIPAGNTIITVTATGADEDTLISMFYQPRKEVLH